uniref:Kinesin motor domain-containing protein n=1 Tax=Heterorhabditis bacteriophora TaxID=37862 RepID=A0A1I7W732_HETBA
MGGSETESNDVMEWYIEFYVDDNKVVNGSTVGDLELESDDSYHACSSDALSLDEGRIPTVGDMNSNPDFDELDGTMTGTGYSRPVSACDDLFVSAHRIHLADRDREWRDYTSSKHFIDEDAVSPTSIYARNRGNPMNEPHRGPYAPFNIEAHNNMLRFVHCDSIFVITIITYVNITNLYDSLSATDPAAYEYMMSFPKLSPEIQRSFDAFMRIIKEPIVSNGRPWIGPRINASSTKKLCEPSICESDFSGGECSFSGVSNANELYSSMEFPVEDFNIGMQALLDTTESRVNKELADKLLFASQNKIDASNTRLSSITYIPASIGLRWSRVITNLKKCASSHASQVEDIIQRIGQLQRISVIIEDYNKEYPCNLSSHSEDMKRRNTTTLPTTKKLRLTGEISHGFSGDVMNLENYTESAEQICASLDYQVTDAIARESRRVIDMGGSISSDMYTVVDALISNEKAELCQMKKKFTEATEELVEIFIHA